MIDPDFSIKSESKINQTGCESKSNPNLKPLFRKGPVPNFDTEPLHLQTYPGPLNLRTKKTHTHMKRISRFPFGQTESWFCSIPNCFSEKPKTLIKSVGFWRRPAFEWVPIEWGNQRRWAKTSFRCSILFRPSGGWVCDFSMAKRVYQVWKGNNVRVFFQSFCWFLFLFFLPSCVFESVMVFPFLLL